MATYKKTQISWDVSGEKWKEGPELMLQIATRPRNGSGRAYVVIPETGVPSEGTQVSWSCPVGTGSIRGSITFFDEGKSFHGELQSNSIKPWRYRGQVESGN